MDILPTTAGPHVAEAGVNASSSFASGFHSNAATAYTNPVGNGSGESFSSNTWSAGDYYQFTTSTLGYQNVTFGWDQTRSSTGPDSFKLEADFGSGFIDIVNPYTIDVVTWSSGTHNSASVFAPVSLGAAADNKSLITVRLTSLVAGSAAAGTNRVDNSMFNAVAIPEPGAVLFGGLVCSVVGVAAAWRRVFGKKAS